MLFEGQTILPSLQTSQRDSEHLDDSLRVTRLGVALPGFEPGSRTLEGVSAGPIHYQPYNE